ncbi:MAG: efflux RND transporter periplasmic adaptor subunit [Candidatus Eisenbacteria bacterium]
MKRTRWTAVILLTIAAMAVAVTAYVISERGHEAGIDEFYVCPMHPQVTQDHPGDCPICGMKLVRQSPATPADGNSHGDAGSGRGDAGLGHGDVGTSGGDAGSGRRDGGLAHGVAEVSLSPSQEILANVAVVPAEMGDYEQRLTLPGRVLPVEGNRVRVSLKTAGRIERLFVSTDGEQVKAGQPLFEYYSPDIGAARRELLVALGSSDPDAGALVEAARARLLSMGLQESDVGETRAERGSEAGQGNETERGSEAERPGAAARASNGVRSDLDRILFGSPISGFVMEKMVREGQWVMPGMDAYEIADLSTVWVEGAAFEVDAGRVRLNQGVEVVSPSYGTPAFSGKITWIAPELDSETRSLPFRTTISNARLLLKPGMYVTVRIVERTHERVVLVPEDAVIELGERQVVYVQSAPGRFIAREVVSGTSHGGKIPVYSGVVAGELVVASGGYLIDSDAQIRALRSTSHAAQGHGATGNTGGDE